MKAKTITQIHNLFGSTMLPASTAKSRDLDLNLFTSFDLDRYMILFNCFVLEH